MKELFGSLLSTFRSERLSARFHDTRALGARLPLLCVDFVRVYVEEASPLSAGVEPARVAVGRGPVAAWEAGVPVVHTRVEFMPVGADGGLFYRKAPTLVCLQRGSQLAEFTPGVKLSSGEM